MAEGLAVLQLGTNLGRADEIVRQLPNNIEEANSGEGDQGTSVDDDAFSHLG